MFRNYIKTAWRNIRKNKIFSFINIAGLAIGMAACLLILQNVSFELSYDQFHKNAANIYRVVNDRYQNGKLIQHGTITYSAIGKAMKDDYPDEIIEHARVEPFNNVIITYNNKKLEEQGLSVDNSFLSMFSFSLVAGDTSSALKNPNTVVLSETLAKKIFDVKDEDFQSLIGKTIVLSRDSLPYKVTGICRDVPENSHLQFDFLISYVSLYSGGNNNWREADYDFKDSDFWHYVQLKPGTSYKALEAKFPAFSQRHFEGNKISGSVEKFFLQPLLKAHLYSDFEYEIGKTASATTVWGLLIIALFIIIIAWVNYINLTTAKSVERAREIGIRKVIGAQKGQLIRQFLAESVIFNIASLAFAFIIVLVTQPFFNNLTGHHLSVFFLLQKGLSGYSVTLGLLLLIVAGIGISGLYPAFVLSSFRPIFVLKGKLSTSAKGVVFRKTLVTIQFVITMALVISSIVVLRQIKFMNRQQLGLNIDQVLVVRPPSLTGWDSTFINRMDNFKEELKQLSNIKGVTTSNHVPGDAELGRAFDFHRMDDSSMHHYTIRNMGTAYDFVDFYEVKVLAGRKLSKADHNPDFNKLHNVLLNESAIKMAGFHNNEEAIGKQVSFFHKQWDIIGVVSDFHQKSLRYPIEPTVFIPTYSLNASISVKINATNNLTAMMNTIKQKYNTFFPGNLFDYYFLDEHFNQQYRNEELFGKVFGLFAGIAIFIACLGLLGLSLFATVQRTKEIGVRKVLGASVTSIVLLLSKDFIWLVLVAFIISSPLAYFIMHSWLQDFAYRINIEWWVFVVAGLLSVAVALATVSWQAIKAAVANPVKSLRTE